jgi:putative addiction module CopG family antidote
MPIEQMNISLPPRMARFIRGKVKAGQYTNASEVVRDAVRHMQEAEAAKKDRQALLDDDFEVRITAGEREDIRRRVQQGVKDLEDGRFEEFDAEGLRQHFAGVTERGKKRLATGVKRPSK